MLYVSHSQQYVEFECSNTLKNRINKTAKKCPPFLCFSTYRDESLHGKWWNLLCLQTVKVWLTWVWLFKWVQVLLVNGLGFGLMVALKSICRTCSVCRRIAHFLFQCLCLKYVGNLRPKYWKFCWSHNRGIPKMLSLPYNEECVNIFCKKAIPYKIKKDL